MRVIITVTEFASMPGRYIVKSSGAIDRRGVMHEKDVSGAEAAAAHAMEFAQRCGKSGYQIFAPERVLACIPDDMRGRSG